MAPVFKAGDSGLALNGYGEGLPKVLYDVKVLDVKRQGKRTKFLVHFHGWKSTYDEWVEEVLPVTEENLAKKAEMINEAKEAHRKLKQKRAAERRELNSAIFAKRPRKSDPTGPDDGAEDDSKSAVGLRLNFSALLKKQLYEDYEKVTIKKMLVRLPRRVTIETLCEEYFEDASRPHGLCSSSGKIAAETVKEILDGLRVFFDRAVGPFLLYSFEKLQYEALREKHPEDENDHLILRESAQEQLQAQPKRKRLSQLYGPEHFLRLLLKLPSLLRPRDLVDHEVDVLQLVLHDVLKFIGKRRERYLPPSAYEPASDDYLRVIQDM